jgi:hypothetical protein
MIATRICAEVLCLSLICPVSAAGGPSAPPTEERRASSETLTTQTPAAGLATDGYNSLFSDSVSRRRGATVFSHEKYPGGNAGLSEGIKLETLLWGGGGAIIGSLAGPGGTIAGGAVGFLVGLSIGIVMPRKQSSAKFRG